jgi:hypothetical protein
MSCCDGSNGIKAEIIEINNKIATLILERQEKITLYEVAMKQYKFYFYSEYRDLYMIQSLEKTYDTTDFKLIKPIFESIIKNSAHHRNLLNYKSNETIIKKDNLL